MLAGLAHLASDFALMAPEVALLVLTLGLLLIYVELNRPGWILSGALGLLAVLFAVASLVRLGLNPGAVTLVGTAVVLLGLGLRRRTPVVVDAAATLALVLGFAHLMRGPGGVGIRTGIAVGCGATLGGCTSILTRIARRARTNKGLD
jgi:membrane-bound ClpP family serine protease